MSLPRGFPPRVPAGLRCQGGPVPDRVPLAPVRGAVGSSADRRAQ